MAGRRIITAVRAFPIKLAMLLLAGLVLCPSAANASEHAATDSGSHSDVSAPSASLGAELPSERSETSQTFQLPDGELETRIFGTPVNYQSPQGDWQPIDESFEELDGGRLTNGANSFDLSLPERLGADPIRLSVGDAWVTTELLGAEPDPVEAEDTTASYESAGGGTNFEFASLPDGLKEEIILAGPSQSSTFHFDLDASKGLTPELLEDGSIQFQNADGESVVTLPAPVMSDSAEPTPAISHAIHYALGPEVEGHWRLTVEADRNWLTQSGRSWPVRLDPTMSIGSNLDCIIGGTKGQTGWIDCSAWGRKVDLVNYTPHLNAAEDAWQRGLMYLETSALPTNGIVSSATLNMYSAEAALNTSGAELEKTSKPWTWEASWSRYAGASKLWTTEGGDYSEQLGKVLTSARGSQAGWWQFALPAKTVEAEAAKHADLGALLKLIDDKTRTCTETSCTQRQIAFSSSAAEETTKRPYLSVVYEVPQAPAVLNKAATSIKGTTATLNAGVTPNNAATTYQFEYGPTTAYGSVVPATAKAIGSGKTEVAVSEPLTSLSSGTTYHFRVSASNAVGKTSSADKSFTTLKAPTVTTGSGGAITTTSATLRGTILPNGAQTTYQFEIGPTTSYGTSVPTPAKLLGVVNGEAEIEYPMTGLTEGSTYHYRLKATNEVGVAYGADKTLSTLDAPETTITSPHPTYTGRELSSVAFSSDQSGSTFKCALDEGEKPTKACSSPYSIPSTLKDGWHTLVVMAVSAGGIADPTPAKYTFNPAIYPPAPTPSDKMTAPTEGEATASYFTLQAEWGPPPQGGGSVTGVTYQVKLDKWTTFLTIPGSCVKDSKGQPVSWPLPVSGDSGQTAPVFLKVQGCSLFESVGYPHKNVRIRAVYDGDPHAAGASEPVTAEYVGNENDQGVGAPTDAVESVGPANLDLVTGQYSISRTDVSIPVPGTESSLEFTRTYESDYQGQSGPSRVLGGMWVPSAPAETQYAGEAWSEIRERHENAVAPEYDHQCELEGFTHEECMIEGEIPASDWVEVLDGEGNGAAFELVGGNYIAPEYMKEYKLTKQGTGPGSTFELASPEGVDTVFTKNEVGVENSYRMTAVSWQATKKSAQMVYESFEGAYRLTKMIAPAPAGVTGCTPTAATHTAGCRVLTFQYFKCSCSGGSRMSSITYYNSSGSEASAQPVAEYSYDPEFRLTAEWDPRLPLLKETYGYESGGGVFKLASLTPPGQSPVTFSYYPFYTSKFAGRLRSVSRASLLTSPTVAQTTIAYEVPISGGSAPYDLGPATVATWGQTDYPVNATAIFPPTEVPGETPSDYAQASIKYLDPDGYVVNTASPQLPGASGQSIATSETDRHGNVVRSLSPQNRLRAIAAGSETVARSRKLDSEYTFTADGTEMIESLGPLHQVGLGPGVSESARARTVIQYDKEPNGSDIPTPPAGTPWPHLPTKEIASALTASGANVDERIKETRYDWSLRKPTDVIVDAGTGELNLQSHTSYDPVTGQVSERSLPANPAGGDAHTTKTVYYDASAGNGPCQAHPAWAGLTCEIKPAAQPGTFGQPEVTVTRFKQYSTLDQPEEIVESPGGSEQAGALRRTQIGYDSAGRTTIKQIEGGGSKIPVTETVYDPNTGLPDSQRFACLSPTECGSSTPQYSGKFPGIGEGGGLLGGPRGVAADGKGHVWVVDRANNRVVEYTEAGAYIRQFGSAGTANGQFKEPAGIAVTPAGNLWVADASNSRLQEFNANGEFMQKFGTKAASSSKGTEFLTPEGIAVAPGGMLWVSDGQGARVGEFRQSPASESERFVRNISGTLPTHPDGVASDASANVWVVDVWGNRILEYDSEGKFIRSVGSGGSGNGEFKNPAGIAVAPSGNVLVADASNNRIEEFSGEGAFLRTFGSTGSGGENFLEPKGIALGASNMAFIADNGHNLVKKWQIDYTFDNQATTATYDSLGRVTKYEDADGNKSETTYDLDGRPVTITDAKGSQTLHYDVASGALTSLEDSATGTFTAAYDADGNVIERALPNGLTAKTTYNETGEPIKLAYTKVASCGESCTWFEEGLERSINGQILSVSSTLASQQYTYDKAGRLKQAQETPKNGSCTTRAYSYDADSNRTELTTRPGIGGACATSGGATQKYEYDAADRLVGGLQYDNFGRITNLPAEDAGGKLLTTSYFSNDMVASQSQNGITNTFELDASLRQRQRLQGGGLEGSEILHYDSGSDAPAWTQLGSTWTRSITGIDGELAAIQDSGSGITFELTNLHGDVVATASPSATATKLLTTNHFDEFGNPTSGNASRFGWLGGKQRPTELPSGVIQMGVRSYVPAIGRFISVDPVAGGSANAYDYATADPVNDFDVGGTCALKKCGRFMRVARRAALRALAGMRARRGGSSAQSIVESIFSPNAPITFEDCVPGQEVGIKATVWSKVMGSNCVPKLHLSSVTSPAETQADAVAGIGWCIAINSFPITSLRTGALSPLEAAAHCSTGPESRPWAYVHADGDGVPDNKSTW